MVNYFSSVSAEHSIILLFVSENSVSHFDINCKFLSINEVFLLFNFFPFINKLAQEVKSISD